MGLPYRLVLTLASVVLAARYVVDSTATTPWRWTIGLATVVSFLLPDGLPWYVCGIGIQLGVSLVVLFRSATARTG